ncbi:SPOR domain-containing protein [Fundidesulfovibrio butyratiphilus]
MKVIERFNVSKPPEGPRTFTFQLSGAGLASVVVVAALCLVWVFILGVLVGRGYKPETAVPELAQMMPSAPAPATPEQKEPPTVLKPEELQFMESLQGKKPTETVTVDSSKKPGDKTGADQAPAQTPAASPPTSSLEKTPAPLPKGQVATSSAQPDRKTVSSRESRRDKPAPAPASSKDKDKKSKDAKKSGNTKDKDKKDKDKSAKSKDKGKEKSSKRYKVTYQVSSVEDRKQAEREADRLTKMGLSSHVEEAKVGGKTVYRVFLRTKGTESDIKSTLDQAGTKKPIQREKKAL